MESARQQLTAHEATPPKIIEKSALFCIATFNSQQYLYPLLEVI